MLVWHSIEHPLDILGTTDDSWQTEYRIRRIVWVNTHVDIVFIADRHNRLQPILHVLLQLLLVDAIIKLQQVAELLDRSRIALAEVTRYEALGLDDDILYQGMILLRCRSLLDFISLSHEVSAPLVLLRELSPILTSTFTLQDIDIKVGKLAQFI